MTVQQSSSLCGSAGTVARCASDGSVTPQPKIFSYLQVLRQEKKTYRSTSRARRMVQLFISADSAQLSRQALAWEPPPWPLTPPLRPCNKSAWLPEGIKAPLLMTFQSCLPMHCAGSGLREANGKPKGPLPGVQSFMLLLCVFPVCPASQGQALCSVCWSYCTVPMQPPALQWDESAAWSAVYGLHMSHNFLFWMASGFILC